MSQIQKIISGGQTGVDQAVIKSCNRFGHFSGWRPPGHICEDGIIPEEFPLNETPIERSKDAPARYWTACLYFFNRAPQLRKIQST